MKGRSRPLSQAADHCVGAYGQETSEGWWFAEPKTARSGRLVPISKEMPALLREHVVRTERRQREVQGRQENRLLFPNGVGEPQLPHRMQKVFKEVIAEMGLDPKAFKLYGTRHAMASAALSDEIHPKVVAERLVRDGVSTTLDVYSHLPPTTQDGPTDELGGVIHRRHEGEESAGPDVDLVDCELPF